MSNRDVHVFFPAAGFGRRVGAPEAKEMLPDPDSGEPLIAKWLNWADEKSSNDLQLKVHVISRKEKMNLNSYLQKNWRDVQVHIVEPTKEWPESLLRVRPHWGLTNLMILPDTFLRPLTVLEQVIADVQTGNTEVSFAVQRQAEHASWGVVRKDRQGKWWGCEKPQERLAEKDVWVWGAFCFGMRVGSEFLSALLRSTCSHEWYRLHCDVSVHELLEFRDLTR